METQEKQNATGSQESVEVVLQDPIRFGSEVIAQIKMRPPKAKDIKNLKLNDLKLGDFLQIASKLSGVSLTALDDLSVRDTNEVVAKISDFF